MKTKRLLAFTMVLSIIAISISINKGLSYSFLSIDYGIDDTERKNHFMETERESIESIETTNNLEMMSTGSIDFDSDMRRTLSDDNSYLSMNEVLDNFNPNVNIVGEYNSEITEGKLEDGNSSITLPGNGQYQIGGNVSELRAQYIQNSGAETIQSFYSENAIQAGLRLNRINDGRSLDGNYSWKLYSNNTESMKYALYQEDIPLYQNDTEISYSYLLESNSSLQYIINSSLIFDFVFDTCRIMVIHWHYTNLEPPLIGDNTTVPFVVYRLLKNSSWDDQWNNYSLSIFELFSKDDPYIPTTLKSVGFYIISPEVSECSILIDNFKIRTSLEPEDINLTINEVQVNSKELGIGDFDLYYEVIGETSNHEYRVDWYHNSSYEIFGNYNISIMGLAEILFVKNIDLQSSDVVMCDIITPVVESSINPLNITYPEFWTLVGEINGYSIIGNQSDGNGYNTMILERTVGETEIICSFEIPNLITNASYSSLVIFDTLNATFELDTSISNLSVNIFWFSDSNGSFTTNLVDNNLIYQFPSWIQEGTVDVTFVIFEGDKIGFINSSFSLTRYPAEIISIEEIVIPRYTLIQVGVNYTSLVQGFDIENPTVYAILDNEQIPSIWQNGIYYFFASAFYLSESNYSLEIYAFSSSHATVQQSINLLIYEEEIEIEFEWIEVDGLATYQLSFNITADDIPVGFAPLNIDINNNEIITGLTNSNGEFQLELSLPHNDQIINITCNVIKISTILASKSFEIHLDNLQAMISRDIVEVMISENMTFSYSIHYPSAHNRWFIFTNEEMLPIIDVYIETDTFRIPVSWDSDTIYWEIQADETEINHKLIIQTEGPRVSSSIEEINSEIHIHFVIEAETKNYQNISLIYYLNESLSTSKYQWRLFSSKSIDVTANYELEVNDLYVKLSGININKGSFLILDLIGTKISNNNTITNIVIPLVSSSGVLLGAITTVVRIYNKKKGMILEI